MAKKHVAVALLPIVLIGLLSNAKNIRTQLTYFSGENEGAVVAPKSKPTHAAVHGGKQRMESKTKSDKNNYIDVTTNDNNCLKARTDTVPPSLYHKLPKPYINLGFPKMGTSSLHAYFECGDLVSAHFKCGPVRKRCSVCAKCMRESVKAGLPPLTKCCHADMYAQIDNGTYFPQIELLDEFVHGHPNATFFLTFRSVEKWYHSISHWPPRKNGPHMDERFKKLNITGSPSSESKSNPKEFSDWYCNHVQRVRDAVANNPSHTLVEVDIEDPDIGQRMEDIFGIKKSCWGHANANAIIHPELKNSSEVDFSKAFSVGKKSNNNKNNKEETMIATKTEKKKKKKRHKY